MARFLRIFAIAALVAAIYLTGGLEFLDHELMDLRHRVLTQEASDDLVLVEIDESSLRKLDVWPWPRRIHARLIDRLAAAGPGRIALDIDFSSHSTPEDDRLLAEALARMPEPVILPVFRQVERQPDGTVAILESGPIQPFVENAALAAFNVRPDTDGRVRRLHAREMWENQVVPHFAALAAGVAGSAPQTYYVNYGIDIGTIPRLRYADVLAGRFDPATVRGKIVLIGATAIQLGDMVTVPVYRALPGIYVQALGYNSLALGIALQRLNPGLVLAGVALLALALTFLKTRESWRRGLAATGGLAAVIVGGTFVAQPVFALSIDAAPLVLTVVLDYVTRLASRVKRQDLLLLAQKLAIRRRDVFMRLVVENSFDAIFTVDANGRVSTFNPAAEDMFGYDRDAVVGMPARRLFPPPPDSDPDGDAADPLHEAGNRIVDARRRDGTPLIVDLSVSRIRIDDDDVVIGLARDITEKTQAETRARKAEQRLLESIESIEEGFALFDAEDRLVVSNRRFRDKGGVRAVPMGEPVYRDIVEGLVRGGVYPDAADDPEAWLAARLAYHRNPRGAVEDRTSDGTWLLTSEHRTQDGGTVVVETDVTRLKTREMEAADLARELSKVGAGVEATTSGVMLTDATDPAHPIVFVNPAFTMITGYTQEEVDGRPRSGLLRGPDTDEDAGRLIDEALAEGRAAQTVIRHYHKDGTPFWDEARVNPVRDETGEIVYYVWILNDVTDEMEVREELTRAKEEAELSSRAKTEFLANMSHELRTPLNAIIGFSEMMTSEVYGPLGNDNYREYIADIESSGRHLLEVINDILDMAKIESGRFEIAESRVDVARAVAACLRLVRERAEQGGLTLETALPDRLPQLRADERIIKQILLNLLSNAVKFTPEGGRVAVRAGAAVGGGLSIAIEDTGIGIEPDQIERALEPFAQLESDLARKYEGTGLGLPLVKRFAELHGGTLKLESAPGKGTLATVTFPAERVVPPGSETPARRAAGAA